MKLAYPLTVLLMVDHHHGSLLLLLMILRILLLLMFMLLLDLVGGKALQNAILGGDRGIVRRGTCNR